MSGFSGSVGSNSVVGPNELTSNSETKLEKEGFQTELDFDEEKHGLEALCLVNKFGVTVTGFASSSRSERVNGVLVNMAVNSGVKTTACNNFL